MSKEITHENPLLLVGLPYVALSGNEEGTLAPGDQFVLDGSGDLVFKQSGGWIGSPKAVESAMKGLRFQVDVEKVLREIKFLEKEIEKKKVLVTSAVLRIELDK